MTDTNHIEAEVSAVIKRLTGCPDIIGYGGESLAGEISRALSARASAGEGGVDLQRFRPAVKSHRDQCRRQMSKLGKELPEHYRPVMQAELDEQEALLDLIDAPQPAHAVFYDIPGSGGTMHFQGDKPAQSGGGGVAEIVRDLCELNPADPDAPETVCVRVADLERIVERHTTPASPATGDKRHVGDSKFESWYADYCRTDWPDGTKQIARDAYAAGMGDTTPQPVAAQGGHAFQPGDRIEWQGSNGTWFPGKIVAVRDHVTTYDAKLDDGCDVKDFAAGRFRMLAAAPQPQESEFFPIPAGLHPHTVNLVARFAAALADKLAKAERKYGYSDGWADADWMDECRAKLIEHVAKGDPRDVAAYCAFLWHHNERTAITPPAPQPQAQDKTRPVSEWIAELRQDPEIAAGMDAAREKRGPRRPPPAHGDGEGVELLPCPRCQSDSNEHVRACRLDFDLLCARCEVCGLAVAEQWVMPWDNAAHVGIWNRATRPTPEAQEARDADTKRLDFIERTFSGVTNRERYLPVQMVWGKGCNGRTLREACDKYMKRDADAARRARGDAE